MICEFCLFGYSTPIGRNSASSSLKVYIPFQGCSVQFSRSNALTNHIHEPRWTRSSRDDSSQNNFPASTRPYEGVRVTNLPGQYPARVSVCWHHRGQTGPGNRWYCPRPHALLVRYTLWTRGWYRDSTVRYNNTDKIWHSEGEQWLVGISMVKG